MFSQKQWYLKRRTRLYIGSNELKDSFSKFKGSIFAILFGLIIGSLVIAATGNSAITYFRYVLYFAFSSYGFNNWDNTLVWWALYIVAGLALVVSFKIGMFNIGAPGQLLASGSVIVAIGIRYNMSQPLTIFVAFIAAVLAAMLVAGVIVLLKVLFNVHEVVSSILLNWTIWYFVKWIFTTSNDLYNGSQGASNPVHQNMNLMVDGYKFIIPIVLAFALVFFVWFLLKKTTIGYKFKTVGLNPFAAQYGGINKKQYAVISFLISGALIGVMGFIYYVGFNPSLSFSTDDLPTLGFDSISVALVGQISAIGVIGSALLWGIIKSGGPIGSTGLDIPNAIGDIIFGVIIYSAACAILLSRLEPIKFIIRYCNVMFNNARRKSANFFIKNIWNKWRATFKVKRDSNYKIDEVKSQIKKLNKENKELIKTNNQNKISENNIKLESLKSELEHSINERNDSIEVLWSQIHQEYKSLNHLFYKEYNKIWTRGIIGITNKATKEKKEVYGYKLNDYVNTKIAYDEFIYNSKQELNSQIKILKKSKSNELQNKINNLMNEYKNKINNKVKEFNEDFLKITSEEKQQIEIINERFKKNKMIYKENINNLQNDFQEKIHNITEQYNSLKEDKTLTKEQLTKYKNDYKNQIKLIKSNYKKDKHKYSYIEKDNGGDN